MNRKYKYCLLICWFLPCTNAFAQIDIVNTTFNTKDANVLFIGIQNIVKVASDKGGYELVPMKSQIEKEKDLFKVFPYKEGVDTLYVKKNGKIVFTKFFTLKFFPPIKLQLGALRQGDATKTDIIASRKIMVDNNECICNIPYRIISLS